MSESIEMCKIVHFYGFQRPKFRVHPVPKGHDFAIRCMNFSSHFEHLICHFGSQLTPKVTDLVVSGRFWSSSF